MPGPVSIAHAEIEVDCTSCHLRFKKTGQTALCLDCHSEIQIDVSQNSGFHGLSPEVTGTPCAACHTDHKGRNADIVQLDQNRFYHEATNFPLEGGHAEAQCVDCHDPAVKYRDTPSACNSCHVEDDPHDKFLGENCADCHIESDWKKVDFDHSTTDYPLLGKHASAQCQDCHTDQTFQKTPKVCNACHQDDDPHIGFLGQVCSVCHNESSWKIVDFNHDSTKFGLRGKHIETECSDCHQDQTYQNAPPDCYSCHKKDDVHEGLSGTDCEACHSEADWQDTSFNHERDTQFSITGAHKKVACDGCHEADPFNDSQEMTCVSCHRKDDVHKRDNGDDCERCHSDQNWHTSSFDHNKETDFIVSGAHIKLECRACHTEPIFDVKLAGGCSDCHADDDPHAGQLGTVCSSCHNQDIWPEVISFDHDFSQFPLLGKHTGLECSSCHESSAFQDTSLECIACHRKDDFHDGRFGQSCESCHNAVDWDIWLFDHQRTEFPLESAHQSLSCESCHKRTETRNMSLPKNCDSCHRQDDVHDGEFGARCDRCHTTRSFKDVTVIERFKSSQ